MREGSAMLKLAPPLWMLVYLLLCAALSWSLDWPAIPGPRLPPLGIALVLLAFIPTAQQQDANENDSFGLLTWPLPERSQSRGGEQKRDERHGD
jgi:hypothetical protein